MCHAHDSLIGAPFEEEIDLYPDYYQDYSIPKQKERLKASLDNVVDRKYRIMMLLRLLCDIKDIEFIQEREVNMVYSLDSNTEKPALLLLYICWSTLYREIQLNTKCAKTITRL